jgi:hypothetical protein
VLRLCLHVAAVRFNLSRLLQLQVPPAPAALSVAEKRSCSAANRPCLAAMTLHLLLWLLLLLHLVASDEREEPGQIYS